MLKIASVDNCVYCTVENPHIVVAQEMNAPGIMTWAGIWSGSIIGPFLFRNTDDYG